MTKYSWNQPICERCWLEKDDNWSDKGIRVPVRLTPDIADIHECAYCGFPTFVGIFVRDNPINVVFPRVEEDD